MLRTCNLSLLGYSISKTLYDVYSYLRKCIVCMCAHYFIVGPESMTCQSNIDIAKIWAVFMWIRISQYDSVGIMQRYLQDIEMCLGLSDDYNWDFSFLLSLTVELTPKRT